MILQCSEANVTVKVSLQASLYCETIALPSIQYASGLLLAKCTIVENSLYHYTYSTLNNQYILAVVHKAFISTSSFSYQWYSRDQ